VPHSCTKGSSGGTKYCQDNCKSPKLPNMYTTKDWSKAVTVSGDRNINASLFLRRDARHKDTSRLIGRNGERICTADLQKSGRGKKVAFARATFRIRPYCIDAIVEAEAHSAMIYITKTPS